MASVDCTADWKNTGLQSKGVDPTLGWALRADADSLAMDAAWEGGAALSTAAAMATEAIAAAHRGDMDGSDMAAVCQH